MMGGWLFEDGPAFKERFSRTQPVANKLIEIFKVSSATKSINIIDRNIDQSLRASLECHVDQRQEPAEEAEMIRNNLWASLIQEFAVDMVSGEIKIITSKNNAQTKNRSLWTDYKGNAVDPPLGGRLFKDTNIPGEGIKTSLTVLVWNNHDNDSLLIPRKLHDRFILIDEKGWHLGGSLNSFSKADLLISEMEPQLVSDCSKRFKNIFEACSKRNKNDK